MTVPCGSSEAASYQLLASIPLGEDADNARYDAVHNIVYVGYGSGGVAAIDPVRRAIIASMPLHGHPEAFSLEATGPRIFVNVPGSTEIAVLDRSSHATLATWDLGPDNKGILSSTVGRAYANFPMALDETHHRLFVGCRSPSHLIVFDTQAGKQVAHLDISRDTDDLFYDEVGHRILVHPVAMAPSMSSTRSTRITINARTRSPQPMAPEQPSGIRSPDDCT